MSRFVQFSWRRGHVSLIKIKSRSTASALLIADTETNTLGTTSKVTVFSVMVMSSCFAWTDPHTNGLMDATKQLCKAMHLTIKDKRTESKITNDGKNYKFNLFSSITKIHLKDQQSQAAWPEITQKLSFNLDKKLMIQYIAITRSASIPHGIKDDS